MCDEKKKKGKFCVSLWCARYVCNCWLANLVVVVVDTDALTLYCTLQYFSNKMALE